MGGRRTPPPNNLSDNTPISDAKLHHLIQKIVFPVNDSNEPSSRNNNNSSSSIPSAQEVTKILLNKHREYRRKNSNVLQTCVEEVLISIAKQRNLGTSVGPSGLVIGKQPNSSRRVAIPIGVGAGTGDTPPGKRKRVEDLSSSSQSQTKEQVEVTYDRLATEHDLQRSALELNNANLEVGGGTGGSMLNANLRNRYKDVQRERDIVARTKQREDEEAKAKGEIESGVAESSPSGSKGLPTIAEKASTGTATAPAKKKKKRMSKSSSNNNLSKYDIDPSASSLISPTSRPKERFENLGGIDSIMSQIKELVGYPFLYSQVYTHLNIDPPRGVLLRGPPGCGKTHLANAIAGELNVTYFRVSAPELVSGMSGESEGRIRELFSAASASAPSLIFMDEIDAIAPKRGGDGSSSGGTKGMEKRMVAQLLTCMDSLSPENNKDGKIVMVLGATNRPDSIDSALRRAGRFDREICMGAPDEKGREGILRAMTKAMRLSGDMNFRLLAKKTPGYVGADVRSLAKEACAIAMNRISELKSNSCTIKGEENDVAMNGVLELKSNTNNGEENDVETSESEVNMGGNFTWDVNSAVPLTADELEPLFVTMTDFLSAIPNVQPSAKREGFATVPDVSWEKIGGLQSIRQEMTLSVLEPITNPEHFEALGLPLPAGVLLYGPPGCGKTLLAKAIANESGANFISVKGPELLDKYVGESERAVRVVFERARSSSPCIVFFDELDSLCPKRGSDSGSGGGGVSERVVNQLLTEMDGLDSRRSIFVIAATNRPELIDPAMLRPGRLDKLLYVPVPSPEDRCSILKAVAKKVKLAPDVDLDEIAMSSRADGYSGADCAALLREAGLAVLKEGALRRGHRSIGLEKSKAEKDAMETPISSLQITKQHFDYAFEHVMPSVSKKDKQKYDKMRDRMARARTRGGLTESQDTSKP